MQPIKRFRGRRLYAAVAALLLAAPFAAAQAESAQSPEYAPPAQQEQFEVSDEMLENFAEAATTVQEVQQEYSAQIQAAEDMDQAQTLREEAQQKMVNAVEKSGLSVTEYNLISQRLQSDPALAQRFEDVQGY
jgi:ribosome-binding protein aMBF1 (putative translation factor)